MPFKTLAGCLLIFVSMAGCSTMSPKYDALTSLSTDATKQPACDQLFSARPLPWQDLSDNDDDVRRLWQYFDQRYQHKNSRNLIVFIDGTNNDKKSNTNIWKLYTLATRQACSGEPVIPYYHEGVGTSFGNLILGSLTGQGVDSQIKKAYHFLVETYQPGDRIFIFGFSRGAYIARSLNGLIEFAGLLKNEQSDLPLNTRVNALYQMYHQNNDGKPKFEKRLYQRIQKNSRQYHAYRCDEAVENQFPKFRCGDKVKVAAIGVFDTVPALGFSRDDYPDDHRTNLFADEGYHAMAIDEQRNDFRPLRFDDRIMPEQTLEEVWFAGAHADVGGGYGDNTGLEWVTRNWMLERFKKYNIFYDEPNQAQIAEAAILEKGQLHDEFLESSHLFSVFGIHWRKPAKQDNIHCSVLMRWQLKQLPAPLKGEEIDGLYRPENLYQPIRANFNLVNDTVFDCSG